jgi:hypothetical protein
LGRDHDEFAGDPHKVKTIVLKQRLLAFEPFGCEIIIASIVLFVELEASNL